MKVTICHEEEVLRKTLREFIVKEDAKAVIWETESMREILKFPDMDLLFLETGVKERNGAKTARKLREMGINIPIIFLAKDKEHIFDAFDVEAFQYLTEPFGEESFRYVYRKAKKAVQKEQSLRTLLFNTRKMTYSLKPKQILYVENDGKKVNLYLEKQKIALYATMQEMEDKLGSSFYRCHRGYLVNMEHIDGYNGDCIQTDNGDCVYLAREKYGEFVKTYLDYLGMEEG